MPISAIVFSWYLALSTLSGKAGQLRGVTGQLMHMRRLNHELVMVATVINRTTSRLENA